MAQCYNDNPPAYSDGVEKGTSVDDNTSTIQARQRRRRLAKNMPSARNILLTLAVCLLLTLGLASAASSDEQSCRDVGANECDEPEIEQDQSSFSGLLGSASPEALHRFLHAYFPKIYQHGVFDSEKSALEAVHSADPELASSIVQLARRQNGNETTTAETSVTTEADSVTTTTTDPGDATTTETTVTPEPSTTDSAPTTDATTTTETSTETPTPDETLTRAETSTAETSTARETSTAVETSTSTETSTTTETPTSTEVTEVTRTTQQASTETATDTETGDAPASTTETESETTTTEPASDPTNGQSTTTGTTLETSKAPPTPSTRTSTFTSTLPGGAQTTVTSVEVITAGLPDEEEPTEAPTGALQSGLAVPLSQRRAMGALVGAVMGGALLA